MSDREQSHNCRQADSAAVLVFSLVESYRRGSNLKTQLNGMCAMLSHQAVGVTLFPMTRVRKSGGGEPQGGSRANSWHSEEYSAHSARRTKKKRSCTSDAEDSAVKALPVISWVQLCHSPTRYQKDQRLRCPNQREKNTRPSEDKATESDKAIGRQLVSGLADAVKGLDVGES